MSPDSHWHGEEKRAIRLVIDEAHQILSHQSFRSQFSKIKELAPFAVQKIYMTGSLPIRLEKRFLLETGLSYKTKILRSPTFQPQISYNLFKVSTMTTTLTRLAIDIAKFMETLMEPNQIGIIFSKGRKEVDDLGAQFTKCCSHSQLSVADRSHNEQVWRAGFRKWMAATTGLIQGIDAPNIGVVIFIGIPYGLINLYQGAGRGGRDGRRSWAIIIEVTNNNQLLPRNIDDDLECLTEGAEFLQRDDCHRLPISETLDDRALNCLEIEHAHLCGRCDPDSVITSGIIPLLRDPPPPMLMEVDEAEEKDEFDLYNESLDMDLTQLPFYAESALPPLNPSPLQQSETINESTSTHPTQSPTIPNDPSTTQTSTSNTSPASTAVARKDQLAIAPTHLIPPTSNDPSTKVLQATSLFQQNMRTLHNKCRMLNKITSKLTLKCVLCWIYRGVFEPHHGTNDLFRRCKGSGQYIRSNWIGFKKRFKFGDYQYCFQCFLPQGNNLPPSHPAFHTGDKQRRSCPLQDFVPLVLIFIRYEQSWWMQARSAFRTLPAQPDEGEYASWCLVVEKQDNFYNGLELVLWFLYVFKSPTE